MNHPWTRAARSEDGYTLIELIISIIILATITGALSATFLTANNANANISERIHESNDAQLTAGFWSADAMAAGGVNPVTGTTDSGLGVFTATDATCGLGGGTLVIGFKWKEWASRDSATTADTFTTRIAQYVYRAGTAELERRTCADGTPTGSVTLATRVAAKPTTACDPSANCPGLPNTVSITVTETNDPQTAPSPYTFTLSATVRPDAQTAPGAGNAAGSPLLALGSGTCSGGTTGLSVSGNSTVIVNGQAAVNATDVGACTAMTANGSIQYTADGTSLVPGGTCSGNRCPPTTTDATRLGDPFASLPVPAGSCSGSGNPALVAGHFQPGVYRSAVTFNAPMDPGTYVLCNSVSFSGSVSGTGVFLYFTGSSSISISGNVDINLTAPTTGDYAGILMWNATTNAVSISGNGTSKLYNGAIYSPKADVTLAGTADLYIGMIVAKRILFSGTGITGITNGSVTPGAPGLTATTSAATLRAVDLAWTTPGYTGAPGSPILGYEYRVDSGGGYGAWTTVPGGLVNSMTHTCGTSDTVATTCTYQVRALNGLGSGTPSNAASAASLADTTTPVVTITAPTAGALVGPVTTFTGTAGNAAGDALTVTVTVYSGAACTGVPLQTLSAPRVGTAWSVTSASMANGAKAVCATQTDWVGHSATAGPVGFTAAQVTNLALANGGTAGRVDKGDTVTVTYGQAMAPASFCAGWNGTTARSTTTVIVTVTNNDPTTNGNDSLTIADASCVGGFNLGKIDLGTTAWVAATTTYSGNGGNASSVVFDATLKVLTMKLGTGSGSGNNVPAQTVIYTPSAAIRDAANTAITGTSSFSGQRF
jgi:prepilin-type N-terminal cleavage/methylation domain-containing protein